MSDKNFVKDYLKDLSSLLQPNDDIINKIINVKNALVSTKENKKKVMIFGNGGSAAIASHVSVDLTKNAKIRSVNLNEADLITCFANDYGYERWIEKAVDFYADEKDILILISSSGKSPNMINAAVQAKSMKIPIITLTGFEQDNPLRQFSELDFWVDSRAYNVIENTHQIWLLMVCDLILGKVEYSTS